MTKNYIPLLPFNATANLDIHLEDHPRVYTVTIEEPWIKEIGITGAYLYSLINILSTSHSYCFASDKFLATKMNMSERQIKRLILELDKKKWIYRNTYHTPKGRVRQMVPKCKIKDFWDKQLTKDNVPHIAREQFLKNVFQAKGQKAAKCKKTSTQGTIPAFTYAKDETGPNLLLRNNRIKDRTTATAVAFSKKVTQELKKSGFKNELIQCALKYLKTHPELEFNVSNPIGWIIKGLKEGWLKDKVSDEIPNVEKLLLLEEENKAIAQKIVKKAKPRFGCFDLSPSYLEFNPGGQSEPSIFKFSNPRFKIEIERLFQKYEMKELNEICN